MNIAILNIQKDNYLCQNYLKNILNLILSFQLYHLKISKLLLEFLEFLI